LDALHAPSSLTQRRQAASNLPVFELPPPNLQFNHVSSQRIPPLVGINTSHPPSSSLGQLLTPPSNSASEGGSSSGLPTGTTPNSAAVPVLPYTPTFFNTGTTPTGYHTGYTPQPWQHGNFPPRSMFSPMPGPSMRNNTNSPTATEGSALPPPPYDIHSGHGYPAPPLGLTSPVSATTAHPGPPTIIPSIHPNAVRPQSQHSPVTPGDGTSKAQTHPSIFTSLSSSAQHPSVYSYSTPTSVSQSPHPISLSAPRISPVLHHGAVPHSQGPFMRPPPPSYSLPAMPGPIMSNVHSPGAQMAMVGNMNGGMLPMAFNSGYAANPQSMYGGQRTNTPQQTPALDRPFKCDQCPQSFNRNHDLKRHKRIHLAVKPFPCNHCDKSFSRKDALKVSPDTYNAMDRVILTRITETYLGERLRQWPFRWRWNRPRGRHQVGFSQRWGE